MAIARRQGASIGPASQTSSTTRAFPSAPLAGSLLIATTIHYFQTDVAGIAISDNLNGAWTKIAGFNHPTDSTQAFTFWYKENSAAGATTVAYNATDNGYMALIVEEYTGLLTSGAFDKHLTGTFTSGATHTYGPTAATTQADELVILAGATASFPPQPTFSAGFTAGQYENNSDSGPIATAYRVVSATGAQSGSVIWNSSIGGIGGIFTFKAAGAPPPSVVYRYPPSIS